MVGIIDSECVSYKIYYSLFALQHRGQEASGISIFDGQNLNIHTGHGTISDVINEQILSKMTGNIGIGHVLYSQSKNKKISKKIQPLVFSTQNNHQLSIAMDVSLISDVRNTLQTECEKNGYIFSTTSDVEIIAALLIHELDSGTDAKNSLINVIKRLNGAYVGVIILDGVLYAFRDPLGFKPLCLGETNTGYIVASESVAIDTLSGKFVRDIVPGELVVITSKGVISDQILQSDHKAHCVFEYIYTARPDSVIDGVLVYDARRKIGEKLAKTKVNADIISPIPDSGTAFAVGFANASGIPYIEGLLKNRYVGRTFIMPIQSMRENAVQLKLNPIRSHISKKSVVLVDDSIVRGTTSTHIVNMIRDFGAKDIHMRIGSPPIVSPCYFGVDFPTREELIANNRTIDEIQEIIHTTSLKYISLEDLVDSIGIPLDDLCVACTCGKYPLPIKNEKCCPCRHIKLTK
ncbi:MAG TPA: amidophosphoribosyltransferase [Methanocorpusculum sp.]|nr:amidophosphoribosyltransferase [Methanocorpusculum sp.]